jgi:acyl-CoA synthetase (AMP-forming)/AMP-acid ligase II
MVALYDALVHWAEDAPERACIVEAETGRTINYQQCLLAVRMLQQHFGEQPQNVFLTLPGGVINAVAWLATLTGGHTLVPLSPKASAEDVQRAVSMFRPDIVLLEDEHMEVVEGLQDARLITRAQCEQWFEHLESVQQDGTLAAHVGKLCVMTSGSTGEPKGVVLDEEQVAWTAEQVRVAHQLQPQDRGFTPLPFFHINAPVVSLCASLLAGSTVVIAGHFSRRNFWGWIERYQISWASIVPTIIAILLDGEKPERAPECLHFVRSASAPLPVAHFKAFEQAFGVPLIETYGLSEAASMICANPLPPRARKAGSVGIPYGISLRVCRVHEEGEHMGLREVAPGEQGEVCISGPNVIDGYYGNADEDSFEDGWFRTGDMGYQDEEGYVFLVGRSRAVINRGGENIAPREIEEVLLHYPGIREAVAVGRLDPIYGEVVVAYIVLNGDANEAPDRLRQSLHDYAAQHLSGPKVPVDFVIEAELPKNHTGKVDRMRLQMREKEQSHVFGTAN